MAVFTGRKRLKLKNRKTHIHSSAARVKREKNPRTEPLIKRGGSVDFAAFFVVITLVLFGVVMIFSSSYYETMNSAKYGYDMYYFLKKQLVWAGMGTVAMLIFMNINYRWFRHLAKAAYILANFLLIAVLIVGEELNGSKRWLGITEDIGFQPSEFAKLAVILFFSWYVSTHREELGKWRGFLKCFLLLLLPVGLIGAANLSTALVAMCVGLIIMLVGSPSIKYFIRLLVPVAGVGALALALPQFAYRVNRIKIWRDPFSDPSNLGFQTVQSLFAVGSGGLFGLGLGQSRQKTFIPEAHNDIIFAIICEELGLVGALIVIGLFAVLFWRGIKISLGSRDTFGMLAAVGIVAMIGIQVVINISVVTNTLPNTGMPLPFISYGGSSLLFTMVAVGVLLNISRFQKG